MRRPGTSFALWVTVALILVTPPVLAQQPEINPRLPPPPPPENEPLAIPPLNHPVGASIELVPPVCPVSVCEAVATAPAALPAPAVYTGPERVVIVAGTRIAVVLDTPLSTRISKQNQVVKFRTIELLDIHEDLELPPDTMIVGSVVKAKRPGRFGKPGELRVKLDGIEVIPGGNAPIVARLDSAEMNAQGQIQSDSNRTADLYTIGLWTLQGTLIGAQVHGGKGAAIGAGAGAAVGLIILMSRRGPDIYLEPGMPFSVVLDQPVELAGADVFAAQQAYLRAHASELSRADVREAPSAQNDGKRDRPLLKRRPKKSQP